MDPLPSTTSSTAAATTTQQNALAQHYTQPAGAGQGQSAAQSYGQQAQGQQGIQGQSQNLNQYQNQNQQQQDDGMQLGLDRIRPSDMPDEGLVVSVFSTCVFSFAVTCLWSLSSRERRIRGISRLCTSASVGTRSRETDKDRVVQSRLELIQNSIPLLSLPYGYPIHNVVFKRTRARTRTHTHTHSPCTIIMDAPYPSMSLAPF